ncbi:hypothetical protein BDZ91DRAFT_32990 [Kalaharituber pfeilii]|nr:hypothetical protein BDZ91DRAFT_32990 [Kalaharituber pfeilii]
MARKTVIIRFDSAEAYNKHDAEVISIIKEDTGTDNFISNPSYPPIYHLLVLPDAGVQAASVVHIIQPAPLTDDAIKKLKDLDGVIVQIQGEE